MAICLFFSGEDLMEFRSHLARVRGFGSSHGGSKHWWTQRLTGIGLIPLVIWFVISAVEFSNYDLSQFKDWLSSNANPLLFALFLGLMLYHGQLGIQVIIEDYIRLSGMKLSLILFTKFISIIFGSYSIFVIMKISFGS